MGINVAGGTIASSNISSTGQFKKNIATTFGLVGYWDSAITSSFESGGPCYDLSGYNQTLTNVGNISTATFGGAIGWNFTTVGQQFTGTISASGGQTTNATIEAWIYPAASEIISGDRGTLFQTVGGSGIYHSWNKSNQYLSNYWYGHPPNGYHETAGAMSRSTWNYTCAIWDYSQSCMYQWSNMTCGQTTGVSGSASTAGYALYIGMEQTYTPRQYAGGIALIRIYNRALQAHEVLNNYLAEKSRFGL